MFAVLSQSRQQKKVKRITDNGFVVFEDNTWMHVVNMELNNEA